MSSPSFPTMDVLQASRDLEKLYDLVARGWFRIEVTREGSPESCVIVARGELESLERALEILGDSEQVRELDQSLKRLVRAGAAQSAAAVTGGLRSY